MMFNYKLDIAKVNEDLQKDGYTVLNEFISPDYLDKISKELSLWNFKFNSNSISAVINNYSYFFSNAISVSQSLLNLICDDEIYNTCEKTLGPTFRLKAHRVYQLQKNYVFPWHTDNKSYNVKNKSKGIVFIIYMNDTFDGETQVIKGTHTTSINFTKSNFNESYINKNLKNKIVSATGKKGTMIIFDQSIIHRGNPIKNNKNRRNAIFFQIDTNVNNAEKLLLSNAYLSDKLLDKRKLFLGLGINSDFPVSPDNSGLNTIPPLKLLTIFLKIPLYLTLFLIVDFRKKLARIYKKIF